MNYKIYLVEETDGNGDKLYHFKVRFDRENYFRYLNNAGTITNMGNSGIAKFHITELANNKIRLKQAIFKYLAQEVIKTKEDEIFL